MESVFRDKGINILLDGKGVGCLLKLCQRVRR